MAIVDLGWPPTEAPNLHGARAVCATWQRSLAAGAPLAMLMARMQAGCMALASADRHGGQTHQPPRQPGWRRL